MEMMKVGIREFRADLADYIASSRPIAVTRHGQTVGYFIPSEGREEGDLAALQKANQALGQLLSEHGIDAEEIVSEFKAARKQAGARRKAGAA
ncbi:MAG: type II toxin-antitoxin system Phd/YefM family antitoxin [Trinickia sp.]|uniref:type II toxin-antitoxin system Phd/YefM family antitoxin n=1 Tax=Trinickia sp. TaxID=2571163 RepID=UPI003F7EBDB6